MLITINEFKYNMIKNNFKLFILLEKLNENDNSTTFEWDFTNDLKDDLSLLKKYNLGKDKVIKYFKTLLSKIEKIPEQLKLKLFKTIAITLLTTISSNEIINTVTNYYNNDTNITTIEKNNRINTFTDIINSVDKTKQNISKIDKYITPTEFSDTLVDFLQYEEGSVKQKGKPVLTAYDIGDGMITIGYGHAELKNKTKMKAGKTTITEDQALDLLIEDIKEAQRGLDRILNDWDRQNIKPKITQNMYDAMISMIYNMGIGNFRTSEFIQDVKNNNFEEASKKILNTNVTYPGHVFRRKKESLLFSATDISDNLLKKLLT